MNRDLLIIYFIIGIILAGLEIYLVKFKKVNRWILSGIVFSITIVVAIPFSLIVGAFASLMQIVILASFYIEDWLFRKNSEEEKIKIKDL